MNKNLSFYQEPQPENKKQTINKMPVILWSASIFGFLNSLWIIDRLNLGVLFSGLMLVLWGCYGFLLTKNFKKWKGIFFRISSLFLFYALLTSTVFTLKHFTSNIPVGYREYFLPLFFVFFLLILRKLLRTGKIFNAIVIEDEEISTNRMYDTNKFDVPDFDTLIIAGIIMNVFYLIFSFFPDHPVSGWTWLIVLKEKFVERGIIPILTVWIFFWALVILYLKVRRINQEKNAEKLILDHFPNILIGTIPSRDGIYNLLVNKMKNYKECIFYKRLSILMDSMEGRREKKKPIDDIFASQVELERNMITSSHTSLRFIIWAIPILGFLGTVWGISLSVSELTVVLGDTATSAVQGSAPGTGFGKALGGLGIAFDTTVIALSLSIIAMLLASYVRKVEDEQVTKAELFVQRL